MRPTDAAGGLTETERAAVAARMTACRACKYLLSFNQGVVVCAKARKCKRCRVRRNSISLIDESSTCPIGKWSN